MEVVLRQTGKTGTLSSQADALLQLLDALMQICVESAEPETASPCQSPECIHVNHMRLKASVKRRKNRAVVHEGNTSLSAVDRKYLVVMNIFESVADHADAHVNQIRGRHLEDLLGELLTVLVDLLYTTRGTFPVNVRPVYCLR